MGKQKKNTWISYVIYGLTVFVIFCLLFESYIELPRLLLWAGRWHPMILHFPIVLLLMAILQGLMGKKIPSMLLNVAVLSALLTVITGFFLGKGVANKGDILFWHQWLGAGVALLSAFWYVLNQLWPQWHVVRRGVQFFLVLLIGIAGHYGGMVSHGEDYLALPSDTERGSLPDNPYIYQDVVNRILEDNCTSCHNANKQKGQLVLTSLEGMLKAGVSGNTLIPGEPARSELIRRLLLPGEDEEHMPPEDKQQLEQEEIEILEQWIALGASDTIRLDHLNPAQPLATLVRGLKEPDPLAKWTQLPAIADSTLLNLSTEYLTINRIARKTNALSVKVYLSPSYDPGPIVKLNRAAANIVELDLSGLPIGESELQIVASCSNLELLELDRTPITNRDLERLVLLDKLRILKVYETGIGDSSITTIKNLKNLNQIYLWNTGFSAASLDLLRNANPNLIVNSGIGKENLGSLKVVDSVCRVF